MNVKANLEEHVHNEHFTAKVAEGVETIRNGREDANEHADHHHALQESTEDGVRTDRKSVAKQEHAYTAEHSSKGHQNETEFRLAESRQLQCLVCSGAGNILNTVVLLAHPLDDRVACHRGENRTDHTTKEGACSEITDLCGVEVPWWTRKDPRLDNGRTYIPAVQDTRGDDSVASSRVK